MYDIPFSPALSTPVADAMKHHYTGSGGSEYILHM